jgi:DNA-binding cell septation regulator SpoVG
MVKFGFFEVQLGFKSCTGYLCKGNVKNIHQISLENNFIIHKVREMQDSSNVQS